VLRCELRALLEKLDATPEAQDGTHR
jgi:hypothetical protein